MVLSCAWLLFQLHASTRGATACNAQGGATGMTPVKRPSAFCNDNDMIAIIPTRDRIGIAQGCRTATTLSDRLSRTFRSFRRNVSSEALRKIDPGGVAAVVCDPSGVVAGSLFSISGGVASLNPRLIAGNPSGSDRQSHLWRRIAAFQQTPKGGRTLNGHGWNQNDPCVGQVRLQSAECANPMHGDQCRWHFLPISARIEYRATQDFFGTSRSTIWLGAKLPDLL
jgi:hypothetical protein